eukprot:COSAG01_NODE_8870_length_2631_cov_3.138231_4_plen_144_part_00
MTRPMSALTPSRASPPPLPPPISDPAAAQPACSPGGSVEPPAASTEPPLRGRYRPGAAAAVADAVTPRTCAGLEFEDLPQLGAGEVRINFMTRTEAVTENSLHFDSSHVRFSRAGLAGLRLWQGGVGALAARRGSAILPALRA